MKPLLLLIIFAILLSCSSDLSDTGFAGSWTGTLLIEGKGYASTLTLIPLSETAFAGNLMLKEGQTIVKLVPVNGVIDGNRATGQITDSQSTRFTFTRTGQTLASTWNNNGLEVSSVFNRSSQPSLESTENPEAPQAAAPLSQNRGHDPNSVGNWMTKEVNSNFLTKRFKKLLPDGRIDGYKMTFTPFLGTYDAPQPEPDEVIERWKQQGITWYPINNSVFCLTSPNGTECYTYQLNGNDLNMYDNQGQVVLAWIVP
ncbi:hypothetical protein [Spirosoma arcticum]